MILNFGVIYMAVANNFMNIITRKVHCKISDLRGRVNLIKLMRPKQWIKNTFVFPAILFSKNIFDLNQFINVIWCFISFCMISSSVYILNDIIDVEKDRQHPIKKYRPIASGEVSKKEGYVVMTVLMIGSFVLAYVNNLLLVVIIFTYFVNNVLYSFKIKHMVIIDVMSIAFGFILRVSAGAVTINVRISPWILLCTLLLALFLGFSKRRNELIILQKSAGRYRKILEEYSVEFIDNMLSIITASILMAYSIYTFTAYEQQYMMVTIPFVLYGIFRYQYIVYKKNLGGSPEDIVLSDKPLMIDIVLWIILCMVIIYI